MILKADAVQEVIRTKALHSRVSLEILRNGHPVNVALTTEALPEAGASGSPEEGVTNPDLSPAPSHLYRR